MRPARGVAPDSAGCAVTSAGSAAYANEGAPNQLSATTPSVLPTIRGFTAHTVEPGNLTIAGMMIEYQRKSFDLKAGEKRYVEVQIQDDDAVMVEMPAAQAREKLAATRGIETCTDEVKKK